MAATTGEGCDSSMYARHKRAVSPSLASFPSPEMAREQQIRASTFKRSRSDVLWAQALGQSPVWAAENRSQRGRTRLAERNVDLLPVTVDSMRASPAATTPALNSTCGWKPRPYGTLAPRVPAQTQAWRERFVPNVFTEQFEIV